MARVKGIRSVSRFTELGKVRYRRCSYRCSTCGTRAFPVDRDLDLAPNLRGHSLEFASKLVLLCTVVPFGKGCELFQSLAGIAVSTQLARALAFSIGTRMFEDEIARADDLWDKRLTSPTLFEPTPAKLRALQRHRRIYIMQDNSKVGLQEGKRGRGAPARGVSTRHLKRAAQHAKRKAVAAAKRSKAGPKAPDSPKTELDGLLGDGWKDARALLIFREEDVAQVGKNRRQILHRRILAHVGTADEWRKLLHMAFHEEGVYTAHEVIAVADGGSGIWELIDDLLPNTSSRKVVQILDWYHAVSHLWAVGRALKGCKTERDQRHCREWVEPLIDYLATGRTANVLQRLAKIRGARGEAAQALRRCLKYLETHRHRMRYQYFRERGMHIGSGAIESVHAWVIQPRCRLPGMRWSQQGINAMLRLRCAWACGTWDEKFRAAATSPAPTPRHTGAAA
jgi:hypothetical protein